MKELVETVKAKGFDCGVAIATQAEVKAGAACGQMTLMNEQ